MTVGQSARSNALKFFLIFAALLAHFCLSARGADTTALPKLSVLHGFKVTPIYTVPPEQGSWICMAVDPQGRLVVSPQFPEALSGEHSRTKLFRLTIDHQKITKLETINEPIISPQGMLYAYDSLYLNGLGPKETGIFRLRQRGKDDFAEPQLVRPINYLGEHGSHALVLGPDKKIYVASGNYIAFPTNELSAASPFRNFGEEQLLPRYRDALGMPEGKVGSPGGTILRMNEDGTDCQIYGAWTRNIYDIAFNPEGELFGYDNDHEWDWGTPWYRPDLLYHMVSAGDFGFREGSAKMPDYFDDVLPPVAKVSIGAPTGVKFATTAKFPEKYRKALFMLEWSYGRIYAAHLHPSGSTYAADIETVVQGTPLNVSDIEVTPDGSMYFITGGRDTKSTLYQIEYTNSIAAADDSKTEETNCANLRAIRHKLETFHGKMAADAVDVAWPYLGHSDRYIRYAARVALEFQPVAQWQGRALAETNAATALNALLALARVGGKELQEPILSAAAKFPLSSLSPDLALRKLRMLEQTFIHQGHPQPDRAAGLITELSPAIPAASEPITREACQLLLYLDAPSAISTTLDLAHHATNRESEIYYLYRLSSISNHWTVEQRRDYFKFLTETNRPQPQSELLKLMKDAGREYEDGNSFSHWLKVLRDGAAKSMPDKLRIELDNEIYGTSSRGPLQYLHRKFVRRWKMSDFDKSLPLVANDRNFEKGEELFVAANCIMCHRFKGKGASIGPELTAIGHRATAHDILESILEPSKVIVEGYAVTIFFMTTGDVYTGKLIEQSGDKMVILSDPTTDKTVTIKKSELDSRQQSKTSPMPEGLVNQLTEAEILDLIAYLQSGGDPKAPQFKQSPARQSQR